MPSFATRLVTSAELLLPEHRASDCVTSEKTILLRLNVKRAQALLKSKKRGRLCLRTGNRETVVVVALQLPFAEEILVLPYKRRLLSSWREGAP